MAVSSAATSPSTALDLMIRPAVYEAFGKGHVSEQEATNIGDSRNHGDKSKHFHIKHSVTFQSGETWKLELSQSSKSKDPVFVATRKFHSECEPVKSKNHDQTKVFIQARAIHVFKQYRSNVEKADAKRTTILQGTKEDATQVKTIQEQLTSGKKMIQLPSDPLLKVTMHRDLFNLKS